MDTDHLAKIKSLVIVAMFSDDDLMNRFVLKGGNAIDLVYGTTPRVSLDIDLSIEDDFKPDERSSIENKISRALDRTFRDQDYKVFDIKFFEKPEVSHSNKPIFWGGYVLEFKIIELGKYDVFKNDKEKIRRNAAVVGLRQEKTFSVQISKYEYCKDKIEKDFENYTIYVYTPEMLVFEKLRAICQQMQEYAEIIPSPSRSARAKDFFDIYILCEKHQIDFTNERNIELLKKIFRAKQVPLSFIGKMEQYREYHRENFISVESTVTRITDLRTYDFYFDYVINKGKSLEPLWKVQPPFS